MNTIEGSNRLFGWLLTVTAALVLAGCGGSDGDDGAAGAPGDDGDPGLACWDLNGNGIPDFPDEDTNGDGTADVHRVFADKFNADVDGPAIGLLSGNGKIYLACIPHI